MSEIAKHTATSFLLHPHVMASFFFSCTSCVQSIRCAGVLSVRGISSVTGAPVACPQAVNLCTQVGWINCVISCLVSWHCMYPRRWGLSLPNDQRLLPAYTSIVQINYWAVSGSKDVRLWTWISWGRVACEWWHTISLWIYCFKVPLNNLLCTHFTGFFVNSVTLLPYLCLGVYTWTVLFA